METGFLWVELSLTDGSPFDGLAAGEFTDMSGRKAKFDPAELPDYITNTQAAIEMTRAESGEVVGLPIDARGHDHGDGAGYIVGVELQGERIRILPRWTDLGVEIISKGIRRWFSATVDLANKVILGGTLTNWPATRDQRNRILLRPIELSQSLYQIEEQTMTDETEKVEETPVVEETETPAPPDLSELMADPALAGQVREFVQAQIKSGVELALAQLEAESRVAQLSQRLTGGTDAAPRGLPVPADELKAFLLSLDGPAREKAEALLTGIQEKGLVDFAEHGHERKLDGKTPLPEWAQPILAEFVAKGGTLGEFFALNAAELGDQKDYNLAEFQAKE